MNILFNQGFYIITWILLGMLISPPNYFKKNNVNEFVFIIKINSVIIINSTVYYATELFL